MGDNGMGTPPKDADQITTSYKTRMTFGLEVSEVLRACIAEGINEVSAKTEIDSMGSSTDPSMLVSDFAEQEIDLTEMVPKMEALWRWALRNREIGGEDVDVDEVPQETFVYEPVYKHGAYCAHYCKQTSSCITLDLRMYTDAMKGAYDQVWGDLPESLKEELDESNTKERIDTWQKEETMNNMCNSCPCLQEVYEATKPLPWRDTWLAGDEVEVLDNSKEDDCGKKQAEELKKKKAAEAAKAKKKKQDEEAAEAKKKLEAQKEAEEKKKMEAQKEAEAKKNWRPKKRP